MKALEFTNDKIVEAAMNPSEYNKAIDAGHDQGVLVGFEFEVCIPEASLAFQLPATERNSEQDKNALAKRLKEISFLASSTGIQYAGEYTVPYDIFDSIFKLKPGIKAPFKTVQAATMDLVKNKNTEKHHNLNIGNPPTKNF